MSKIREDAPHRIDEAINKMEPFAKEICTTLRDIIHNADPDIIEDWKWGPNFNHNGMVCGFWGFKKHVSFVFYNGVLLKDTKKILLESDNQHNRMVKFVHGDKVNEKLLISYIKEAVNNNIKGVKPTSPKKELVIPSELKNALSRNKNAEKNFESFAYTYRKEYINWIIDAKREETREKRLHEVVARSEQNKKMHEKYMK